MLKNKHYVTWDNEEHIFLLPHIDSMNRRHTEVLQQGSWSVVEGLMWGWKILYFYLPVTMVMYFGKGAWWLNDFTV